MDEQSSSQAPDTAVVSDTSPIAEGTTPTPDEPSTDNDTDSTPAEPSDPAPQTPDPGIEPDKEAEPDTGDEPANPAPQDDEPDVSKMTRRERAEYFQSLNQDQIKQVERAIDSVYQPQPVEELKEHFIEQGYSEGEALLLARDEVRSQREQINEARAEIAELNMTLATQAMDVVNTIPWLNSQNEGKGYDKKSTEAASTLYEQLAINKDPRTGQIIEAKITPKEFYGLIDQIRSSGTAEASLKAQKNAEREMAAVAAPSSTTNARETSFENMNNEQKRAYLRAKGHDV